MSRLPVPRRSRPDERALPCSRCHTVFRPGLTAGACPVCGQAMEAAAPAGLSGLLADPGNRVVALVVAATLANALLLAVLAVQVSRTG